MQHNGKNLTFTQVISQCQWSVLQTFENRPKPLISIHHLTMTQCYIYSSNYGSRVMKMPTKKSRYTLCEWRKPPGQRSFLLPQQCVGVAWHAFYFLIYNFSNSLSMQSVNILEDHVFNRHLCGLVFFAGEYFQLQYRDSTDYDDH